MDLANIIALVSQHNADPTTAPEVNVEPEIVETVIGRNLPKPERASKKQASSGEQAAPIRSTPGPVGVALTDRGTLDAKGFLLALRDAGKRPFQATKPDGTTYTVVKVDQGEVRNDTIRAIHAFYYEVRHGRKVHVGYDPTKDFGSQETAARALAQRELRGFKVSGPTREEQRAASRTMQGFVAGMPAPSQKLLANLRAREQAAVEAMLDAKTAEEKLEHGKVLAHIRSAIDELV